MNAFSLRIFNNKGLPVGTAVFFVFFYLNRIGIGGRRLCFDGNKQPVLVCGKSGNGSVIRIK